MRKIDDETKNGIPYDVIEDYYESLDDSYWTCIEHVHYEITGEGKSLSEEQLLTKKLNKLCVD